MAIAQSHSHDGADAQSVLIILTLAGMTAALVSQFIWPGWWGGGCEALWPSTLRPGCPR